MNIYVSNLSFNVEDEDLREFFADYGEVTSAKVITDKFTGKSRGFGFVEMSDDEAAREAMAAVTTTVIKKFAFIRTKASGIPGLFCFQHFSFQLASLQQLVNNTDSE